MENDSAVLELVRKEATKFGRCCDVYQDSLGTFADHECQQRTFAMLQGVQRVLGVNKGCSPLSEQEALAARREAIRRGAADDLLQACKEALIALSTVAEQSHITLDAMKTLDAAIRGATRSPLYVEAA